MVRSVLLSRLLAVTVTPGMIAPDGSVTVPVTSAEFAAWPQAIAGKRQAIQANNGRDFPKDSIRTLIAHLLAGTPLRCPASQTVFREPVQLSPCTTSQLATGQVCYAEYAR